MSASSLYRKNAPTFYLLSLCLTATPLVWSQSTNLGAHVHGEAELLMAIEGQNIEMHLLSPAANVLGFEHAPVTEEQREQLHRVEALLSDADSLFDFGDTNCVPRSHDLELPFAEEHETEEEQEAHSEVSARYVFECDESPVEISAELLNKFPLIEVLEVQWITDTTQGAQDLRVDQAKIELN